MIGFGGIWLFALLAGHLGLSGGLAVLMGVSIFFWVIKKMFLVAMMGCALVVGLMVLGGGSLVLLHH